MWSGAGGGGGGGGGGSPQETTKYLKKSETRMTASILQHDPNT